MALRKMLITCGTSLAALAVSGCGPSGDATGEARSMALSVVSEAPSAASTPLAAGAQKAQADSVTASSVPAGYTLAFADEFDGSALDTGKWYYRVSDGQYAAGYLRAQNVSVSGGSVKLRYDYETIPEASGPVYTGGGITSRNRFGYGYYEIRAKLYDAVAGVHTSFWWMGLVKDDSGASYDPQISADIDAGTLPEYGRIHEIDGFEYNSAQLFDMGTHKQSEGTLVKRLGAKTPATIGFVPSDWNVFGFEYTPTTTRFYINGVLKLEVPTDTYPSPFSPSNFWLSSVPFTTNPNNSLLPGYSEFDYFRYYKPDSLQSNLLSNGNFDALPVTNPGLWLVPGWQENYDKPASYIVTAGVHSGTRALHQGLSTAYTVTTKQDLKFIPNGTYRLTAYVKSSGGQAQAAMRVLGYGGSEIDQNIGAQPTWTQITIDNVQVTNGSATVAFTSIGSGGQSLDIDDVVFQRIS